MIVYAGQIGGPPQPQSGGFSLARWIGGAVLAVFGLLMILAVAIAATAAAMIGLIVAAAMLVLRLIPRGRKPPVRHDGPIELEARRTPDGWVAEAAPRSR